MIINKDSTDWAEPYKKEFMKVLKFMEMEGVTPVFKYLKNGKKGFNPYGVMEVWFDITDGLPSMDVFKKRARHETFHKKRELMKKKKPYDEVLAIMAEYFDFVARGELPAPLNYLSRIFANSKNSYKTSDMTLSNP